MMDFKFIFMSIPYQINYTYIFPERIVLSLLVTLATLFCNCFLSCFTDELLGRRRASLLSVQLAHYTVFPHSTGVANVYRINNSLNEKDIFSCFIYFTVLDILYYSAVMRLILFFAFTKHFNFLIPGKFCAMTIFKFIFHLKKIPFFFCSLKYYINGPVFVLLIS